MRLFDVVAFAILTGFGIVAMGTFYGRSRPSAIVCASDGQGRRHVTSGSH